METSGEKFFVYDDSDEFRKVNPSSARFNGTFGRHTLTIPTEVNGHVFPAGKYPFVFWGKKIYDRYEQPIVRSSPSQSEAECVNDDTRMLSSSMA